MARFSHLPLYIKTYEFLKIIYRITKQFRKEFKYTLGAELQQLVWQILDTIIEANSQPDFKKEPYIRKISILFDKFKIRFRFAYEINLLTGKKFEFAQRELEEIGRMISGWLRWAERQRIK